MFLYNTNVECNAARYDSHGQAADMIQPQLLSRSDTYVSNGHDTVLPPVQVPEAVGMINSAIRSKESAFVHQEFGRGGGGMPDAGSLPRGASIGLRCGEPTACRPCEVFDMVA